MRLASELNAYRFSHNSSHVLDLRLFAGAGLNVSPCAHRTFIKSEWRLECTERYCRCRSQWKVTLFRSRGINQWFCLQPVKRPCRIRFLLMSCVFVTFGLLTLAECKIKAKMRKDDRLIFYILVALRELVYPDCCEDLLVIICAKTMNQRTSMSLAVAIKPRTAHTTYV